jgi:serine/threonine-protein kinase
MLPNQQVGPFTVERELGYGAMGAVYLARYKNGQRVALKFIAAGAAANPRQFERFEREAEILKQLKHRNIVRLFGHGKHQKLPYYAMEYIEGQTLQQVLEQRGRLPWEEVVRLGKQLCAALQHAHDQGIIHRDLKPSNLMVLPDGTLKLTDFGIAKDLDVTQLTSANCTVGTASYMSPEQCKGERNLTHRSDLYSLGVVFYELLTGQKPFDADNAMEMFLLHVKGRFERPSRLAMDIPPWLDTLVCQLLEKKPDKRPFDATVVAAALEQVVEKVTAQQSAGVDALTGATATGARLATRTLGGKDREAARTLAQSLGKTKKKRKKPFFQRAWVQALGIALALAAVGGLIFIAVQPASPDTLYGEAKRLMDSGNADKKERARDDPIAKYLKFHRKRMAGSDQLKQVEAWADEVDVERLERRLVKRMKMEWKPEGEIEAAAQQAIRQEEGGDFNSARSTWQGLLKNESDGGDRVTALLATRRLNDLKAAEERLLALQRKVDLIRAGQDQKPDSESEGIAVEALRFDRLGDAALAARRWTALKLKNNKDGGDRIWLLIAAWQAKEQKDKAPKAADEKSERRKLLNARLDAARKLADEGKSDKSKKDEARLMAYEVVLLYESNNDVPDQVEQAKKLIEELRGS